VKTLYFFRHAKSDWDAEFGTDFERPLSKRGQRAASTMGEFLRNADKMPELILCSSAVRTRKTLQRATKAGGWDSEIEYRDELYTGNPRHVLRVIREVSKRVDSLMVVGHETAMSETTSLIIGQGDLRFPTAAIACMELEIRRWKDAAPGCGRLIFFLPPRLLG
jgi:phosphohistidine phosphatase